MSDKRVASQIAVGAIRYFMLKFSRGKVDCVRHGRGPQLRGVKRGRTSNTPSFAPTTFSTSCASAKGCPKRICWLAWRRSAPTNSRPPAAESDPHDLWALVFESARLDEVVDQTIRALEFSVLAKYAFGLAQLFNAFYHRYPILNEEDRARRRWRAAGVAQFRAQMTRALDLMGIEVPTRM